jgi:hypothetical protein
MLKGAKNNLRGKRALGGVDLCVCRVLFPLFLSFTLLISGCLCSASAYFWLVVFCRCLLLALSVLPLLTPAVGPGWGGDERRLQPLPEEEYRDGLC